MTSKLIADFFRPFSEEQAFFAATIAKRMDEFGLDPVDVVAMIDALAAQRRDDQDNARTQIKILRADADKKAINSHLKCPKCGDAIKLFPVNVSKCTAIGGPWQTSIMCRNEGCMFNELSEKTVKELLR